jgi:hypothetical protein
MTGAKTRVARIRTKTRDEFSLQWCKQLLAMGHGPSAVLQRVYFKKWKRVQPI